jgi:hypothetical protein
MTLDNLLPLQTGCGGALLCAYEPIHTRNQLFIGEIEKRYSVRHAPL